MDESGPVRFTGFLFLYMAARGGPAGRPTGSLALSIRAGPVRPRVGTREPGEGGAMEVRLLRHAGRPLRRILDGYVPGEPTD